MKNYIKKGFLCIAGCLLSILVSGVRIRAEEPFVSVVCENGLSVLIREGEPYYTNAPLYFYISEDSGETAVCEYALSSDGGQSYSDWTTADGFCYTLVPDVSNSENGLWHVKFRKIIFQEEDVSQNEI
ncbi:MAG TPA: hypothetical protein PLU43_05200, partial [Lachnospiraceae bacterium]|nr:hypothetical protein [Lachnospiraceae bacterium]